VVVNGSKVLVVDDEPAVRDAVERALHAEGFAFERGPGGAASGVIFHRPAYKRLPTTAERYKRIV
jgi:DNA-binding response OmpR family regulator